MREEEGKEASTVRQRLTALSSLFTYLVKFGVVETNPVREVEWPAVNRREGMTLAFSQSQPYEVRCSEPLPIFTLVSEKISKGMESEVSKLHMLAFPVVCLISWALAHFW
jgi:hypothetical protein